MDADFDRLRGHVFTLHGRMYELRAHALERMEETGGGDPVAHEYYAGRRDLAEVVIAYLEALPSPPRAKEGT